MRCILHIGTPKTGTTQLQHWLEANSDALSRHGVALCESLRAPNNRLLASIFSPGRDKIRSRRAVEGTRERERFAVALTRRFDAELARKRPSHASMILTSEHLYRELADDASIGSLRDWLAARFAEVRVVCYVREQADLHRSRYSNLLRKGEAREPCVPEPDAGFFETYDYGARLAMWERAFGRDAIHVGLYDRERLVRGDIRADFRASMLPDVDDAALDFGPVPSNRSFTRREAVIAAAINRSVTPPSREAPDRTARRLKEGLVDLPFLEADPKHGPRRIPHPGAMAIHERMEAANARFFEHWFGATESLFAPPPPEPHPSEDGATSDYSEDEVVRIVEAICATDGLTVIGPGERARLRGMADRLARAGAAPNDVALLRAIAKRCETAVDPDGD